MRSNKPDSSLNRRDFLVGGGLLAGSGLAGVTGCSSARGAPSPRGRRLTFAYEGPDTTGQGIAADIFQRAVQDLSGGKLKAIQYPNSQLGGEPELLQKIRLGELDLVISSTANAAQLAPQSGVFSLHYLFGNEEQVKSVVTDGAVNRAYKEMVRETVDEAHPLTLFTLPLRNFYAKFGVRDIADIQNQKIRVQATSTEDILFREYGAVPVHMPFPELYTGLQTGVVDLAENAVSYYGLNRHHEVAPVMSFSRHEGNLQVLWVSDNTWQNLSRQERAWIEKAADKVRAQQPDAVLRLTDKLMKEYRSEGVDFVHDVDKAAFRRLSVPLQESLAETLGDGAAEILKLVRAVADRA